MTEITYPEAPQTASAEIVKPSKQFNNEVLNMLGALLLFVITYILLFITALGVAAVLVFCGYFVITLKASFMTLALGLALAAAGVMLVFFLLKFLFKKAESADHSDSVEITADEHPRLFQFIESLTAEVGVAKPGRVLINHDVNASVFYQSPFWSMFFPVKKNLKIGLGLVNSVNQSEFKALLAHEFGHFSQRSMRFGSYVYNLNKVLHNLLYDNEGFANALESWGRIHNILKLTAIINVWLIRGIQYVLRQVYILINKSHMRLSREMEFQADAISAYVSGSNQTISLLRRSELGQMCFENLLNYWNQKLQSNQRSANFYPAHSEMIRNIASEYHLDLDQSGLPVIRRQMDILNNRQVSVDDQWAAHPTPMEREQFLSGLDIHTTTIADSAWQLFSNPEALQRQVTDKLYEHLERESKLDSVEFDDFKAAYDQEVAAYQYPAFYRGYYNYRTIGPFDLEQQAETTAGPDVLFSDYNTNLPRLINGMNQDTALLTRVISNDDYRTFDYRGTKYYSSDAPGIVNTIKKEIEGAEKSLARLDQDIYLYCRSAAGAEQGAVLKAHYQALFDLQPVTESDFKLYSDLGESVDALHRRIHSDPVKPKLVKLSLIEKLFKERLAAMMNDDSYRALLQEDQQETLSNYVAKEFEYFTNGHVNNESINALEQAATIFYHLLTEKNYVVKKTLLEYQLNMLQP